MRERTFIKGDTTEAKFMCLERVLQRMHRRLHKTVVGIIPPSLYSTYVDEPPTDGILLRNIFPSGTLTKGFMFVEQYADKKPVTFVIDIEGPRGKTSQNFLTRRQLLIVKPNIKMETGDRLTFKVEEPDKIKGVWVGFLFDIALQDAVKQTYVVDQLEALLEEEYDSEEEGQ